MSVAANILVLISVRHPVETRRLIFLSLGGLLGIPFSAYGLSKLDLVALKIALVALAMPFAILLIFGHSYHI